MTGVQTCALPISNSVLFRYEDYQGNLMTAMANNNTINVTLQFYQFAYPITQIGTNYVYDFYQLQSKITRRVMN